MTIAFWLPGHLIAANRRDMGHSECHLQEGAQSFSSFFLGFSPSRRLPNCSQEGPSGSKGEVWLRRQARLLWTLALISLPILIIPDLPISVCYRYHHNTLGWACTVPKIYTWEVKVFSIIGMVCLQFTQFTKHKNACESCFILPIFIQVQSCHV